MAQNTSLMNPNEIKSEVLQTFDNIDGELNIHMNDSVNSEMIKKNEKTTIDVKTEVGTESGRLEIIVEDENCNITNGHNNLNLENKENDNAPAKEINKDATTNRSYNLRSAEAKKKLADRSGTNLNNSGVDGETVNSLKANLDDSDICLLVSDDSDDSDTEEVDSDSDNSVTEEDGDQNEKLQDSASENHENAESIDETLQEAPLENSTIAESGSQDKPNQKSSQITLDKFLVPRELLAQQESPEGINDSSTTVRISISHLIINSCTYCDKGDTTYGIKPKKCKECGKRMKFNCFICNKLYNSCHGIYKHVVDFHGFRLNLLRDKIHAFTKNSCSTCKETFNWQSWTCPKCKLNLEFDCAVCNKRCGTRSQLHVHVVNEHIEEFVTSPKKAGAIGWKTVKVGKGKSLLKDYDDQDRIDVSLDNKNTPISIKPDTKRLSSGKRKVRFQLNNAETDRESEVEDIPKSEATVQTLPGQTPRYPVKRRSAKIVDNTETQKYTYNPKQSASNKRDGTKKDNKIATNTPTGPKQQVTRRRRSNPINNHDVDSIIAASEISAPKKPANNKRRRSASMSEMDISENNNHRQIVSVDVHSVDKKNEPSQQTSIKRRSLRNSAAKSETRSHLEDSYADITSAPELSTTNKRRRSRSSLGAELDNSEISMNESGTYDDTDRLNCSRCQRVFADQSARGNHEKYCKKDYLFCDSCPYATKNFSNFKRHKMTYKHKPNEKQKKVESKTSSALLNENVEVGTLHSTDPTCLDVLNKMEAHCPKCKEDSKMKPNDSYCLKCKSKLMLSCVNCCKVFADFLSIFNHLYKECSGKQFHCARCDFATPSLEIMQIHVLNDHSEVSSNSSDSDESSEAPFVFAAQTKAPAKPKAKLKVGYKTRAQSRMKPKVAKAVAQDRESKIKKCPKCHVTTYSLLKHRLSCKAELWCPFCSYKPRAKHLLNQHLAKYHSSESRTAKFKAVFNEISVARADIQDMMQSYCKFCDLLEESVPFKSKCTNCQANYEYRCTKCPATFDVRDKLRKHVRRHAKPSNYSYCTGCSKRFASVASLRMHEKVCTAALANKTI